MKTLLTVASLVLLTCGRAFASSTIYDGVIQEVEHIPETRSKNTGKIKTHEDVKLTIRVLCSPYSNRFNFRRLLLTPGRAIVATSRRGRLTPDALSYSSEMPAAWGTITKTDGDTVTLEAPEIEGTPISGEHQITMDADAEFVHLGQPIDRSEAIKAGALIRVYSPHPARFFVDN